MPRVFKRSYTDRNGRRRKTKNYYGHVTDEFDVRRRVTLCTKSSPPRDCPRRAVPPR